MAELDSGADREAMAADHLGQAIRYARAWCVATGRDPASDTAADAAVDGLLSALDRWDGWGRFATLLHACVAVACRHGFGLADRERSRLRCRPVDPARIGRAFAGSPAGPASADDARRAAVAAWRAIEARDRLRRRDEIRAFRLVFGLPDYGRGSRASYLPPMTVRDAAKAIGRSPAWVDRAVAGFLAELRAAVASDDVA